MSGDGRDWLRALWRFQNYHVGGLGLIAAALFLLAAEGDALFLVMGACLALFSVLVIARARRTR
ncbi:MAG: hypothetical protein WD794_01945 [Mycobacteriales bacterium]